MGVSSAQNNPVGFIPAGCVIPYAGANAPAGWLLCAGQAVSRTDYGALFAVVGTTYGSGDGSTTFNLPDLRGRTIAGVDNMGGSAAGRLTNTVLTASNTIGATGGTQTHTLTGSQSGTSAHGHTASSGNDTPDHSHGAHGGTFASGTATTYVNTWANANGFLRETSGAFQRHTHPITVNNSTAANASEAHTNTQPTMVMNYIIKAVAY